MNRKPLMFCLLALALLSSCQWFQSALTLPYRTNRFSGGLKNNISLRKRVQMSKNALRLGIIPGYVSTLTIVIVIVIVIAGA